jgi:hydrogenase-4 component B
VDAVTQLFHPAGAAADFNYLNALSLSFQIDTLSAFFLMAIFAVSMLASLYSYHYLDHPDKALRTASTYLFFSLLVVSMALVVTAANLITFMLSWEIMSLSSFFLVIFNYESQENRKAGYLYFVFSQVGAMFILAAFGVMYAHTGNFEFTEAASLSEAAKIWVFVLAFIGFGSKAGIFPFHVWLPHAHPAASSHISAVMSGVMIKTGIYGILRIYALLEWHTPAFGSIVLVAGMISGILGVVYALGQHDLKRLLAYSSIENMGIIAFGTGIGGLGAYGAVLCLIHHSLIKSSLFLSSGNLLLGYGSRLIAGTGRMAKLMPRTFVAFFGGFAAISGFPPFGIFIGELFIIIAAFKAGSYVAIGLFILSICVIFAGFAGHVMKISYSDSDATIRLKEKPAMVWPQYALLLTSLLLCFWMPDTFYRTIIQAVNAIGGGF